ncbi:pentapeptide repeat-containing protein [Terasakiella sp. A23]|uniref:pentapeptide repeat-containing protein n=1 Tax=Terasakiella sp. FCG-A23 TaxID=3080561 RepID=UPI002952C41B|nr:pentapeptide repeat-containing protein [Terasakiella sp. A23]MDV7341738.1 pentapeptide repeat-containing protein [Terasakiella sp. A23]
MPNQTERLLFLTLAFFIIVLILLSQFPEILELEWIGEKEDRSAAFRNYFLMVGGSIGLYLAYQRTRAVNAQQKTTESGQITDRYSKAVEQLGNTKNPSVRIGGLYALQRIAKDSDEDLPTVQNVIANFIRNPPYEDINVKSTSSQDNIDNDFSAAPLPLKDCPDIFVAFDILQSISKGQMLPSLRKAKLSGFDLTEVNFQGVDLSDANMLGTRLTGANLQNANLKGVNFYKSNLFAANLVDSNLNGAILEEASFYKANLTGANLTSTLLEKADFRFAILIDANFNSAFLASTRSC